MFDHLRKTTPMLVLSLVSVWFMSACALGNQNVSADDAVVYVTVPPIIITATPMPASATPLPATATALNVSNNTSNLPNNDSVGCTLRTDWQIYMVIPGDTLGNIAQRANTTIASLTTTNCLANADVISVGQTLYVPTMPIKPLPQGSIGNDGTYITIMPATLVDNEAVVTAGTTETLSWYNIPTGAVRVDFMYYSTLDAQYYVLATDTILSDGASILWTIPQSVNGFVYAIAFDSNNSWISFSDHRPIRV